MNKFDYFDLFLLHWVFFAFLQVKNRRQNSKKVASYYCRWDFIILAPYCTLILKININIKF